MMKLDYLHGTPYEIRQEKGMFHVNSDTELLGKFMKLKHSDSLLDIGCNNGALMLYAAAQKPAKLTGIDLFEDVIALARENLSRYEIEADLYAVKAQEHTGGPYDVIVCNPPYFPTENDALKNSSEYLCAARHEEYLTLSELFETAGRLLNENGRFYLVHRASRIPEILKKAEDSRFKCVRMRIAYESENGPAKSVLMELRRGAVTECRVERPVFLNDRETFGNGGTV